jgi:hypothetical protein
MGKKKKKRKKLGFQQTRAKLIADGWIELTNSADSIYVGCTCTRDEYIHIHEPTCKIHGNVIQ